MAGIKKVFCEHCQKEVDFSESGVSLTGRIKGKDYQYEGKEARCALCHAAVNVPKLDDANLKALYDVYRKENGFITVEQICQLPEMYSIGVRPLSLLLGWGEHTFSRYIDGDLPTKQYSDTLLRIYDDPEYYSELLESNKSNLPSSLSYEKSRKAVDALLTAHSDDDSKIELAIEYVSYQCEDITPLAMQKALYYIQGFYYAFNRKFLFSEDCEATDYGPVYKKLYYKHKNYQFAPNKRARVFDSSGFSTDEKVICDSVINNILCYSGKILERFTRNENPWLSVKSQSDDKKPFNRTINKELIGEYFSNVKEKYHMVNPSDITDYASDMFRRT